MNVLEKILEEIEENLKQQMQKSLTVKNCAM